MVVCCFGNESVLDDVMQRSVDGFESVLCDVIQRCVDGFERILFEVGGISMMYLIQRVQELCGDVDDVAGRQPIVVFMHGYQCIYVI